MRHSREDDVGLELPDETQKAECSVAHAPGPHGMHGDPGRQDNSADGGVRDDAEMDLVFLAREVAGQQSGDLLGPATTEVGDQHEYADAIHAQAILTEITILGYHGANFSVLGHVFRGDRMVHLHRYRTISGESSGEQG